MTQVNCRSGEACLVKRSGILRIGDKGRVGFMVLVHTGISGQTKTFPGIKRGKFHNQFKLVRVVSRIIHTNTKKESVPFSSFRKSLSLQCTSLKLYGTLSSIIDFALNRFAWQK